MATPDAAAQEMASDQRVPGAAGLVGGSPPFTRRHPDRRADRVTEPAAIPLNAPTTFHTIRRSATPRFSPDCCARNHG